MTIPPPPITLRPWSTDDLPLLVRLMGDPAMMEHLGGPETPEQILNRHWRYCLPSATGGDGMFAILVAPQQTAAGVIGFWETLWQGQPTWETGWSVLPEFQGQGIATQAARRIIELARAEAKHAYLHAFPAVDNPPSNAICRKAGFTLVAEVDFEHPPRHWMRCNDWRLELFSPDKIANR